MGPHQQREWGFRETNATDMARQPGGCRVWQLNRVRGKPGHVQRMTASWRRANWLAGCGHSAAGKSYRLLKRLVESAPGWLVRPSYFSKAPADVRKRGEGVLSGLVGLAR
jgi:hypothetical protein